MRAHENLMRISQAKKEESAGLGRASSFALADSSPERGSATPLSAAANLARIAEQKRQGESVSGVQSGQSIQAKAALPEKRTADHVTATKAGGSLSERRNLVPSSRQILGLAADDAQKFSADSAADDIINAHRADISESEARRLLKRGTDAASRLLGTGERYAPDLTPREDVDEGTRSYMLRRLAGAAETIEQSPDNHERLYRQNARRIAELEGQIAQKQRAANEAALSDTSGDVGALKKSVDNAAGDVGELKKELDNLRADNLMYDRLTRTEDEIKEITKRPNFSTSSSADGIKNPEERYKEYVTEGYYKTTGQTLLGENSPPDELPVLPGIDEGYHLPTWRGMTDKERAVWYYKVRTDGEKAGEDYLKAMDVVVGKRTLDETSKAVADSGVLGKIGYSALSVPFSVFGAPFAFAKDLAGMATDSYNPYRPDPFRQAQAMREGVGRDMSDAGRFFYDTGMSMLDSVAGAATLGKPYTVIMGMGAASRQASELWEDGASRGQILAGAGLAGVAEALFEELSLDRLLSEKTLGNFGDLIGSIVKQGGVEASEEVFTELANTVTDTLVRGNTSDLVKRYDANLEACGGDESAAFWKTIEDKAKDVGLAAAGGFLSGAGMSAVFDSVNYHNSTLARMENKVKSTRDTIDFVNMLSAMPQEGEVIDASRRVRQKYGLDAYASELIEPTLPGSTDGVGGADSTGGAGTSGSVYSGEAADAPGENKNAPTKEAAEYDGAGDEFERIDTTSLSFRKKSEYTPQEARTVQEYIDSADERIAAFARRVMSDKNAGHERLTIGPLSERQAADASRLLGKDFSGYVNAVDSNGIKHIEKRHGENGQADSTMRNVNDIARVGYVLDNYDSVEVVADGDGVEELSGGYRDRDNTPAPILKYSKK